MNIQEKYQVCVASSSDINEHLSTLFNLANEVQKITEFGTRDGDSTTAFLAAIENSNKTLTCYDLYKSSNVSFFEQFSNFKFSNADTLEISIENTDLLFIDTLHTYFQLYNELLLHSEKVSKYIVLHDTTTYGIHDEPFYQPDATVKMSEKANIPTVKTGLVNAINDFISEIKDGQNWLIFKTFTNNNGLTILKRK